MKKRKKEGRKLGLAELVRGYCLFFCDAIQYTHSLIPRIDVVKISSRISSLIKVYNMYSTLFSSQKSTKKEKNKIVVTLNCGGFAARSYPAKLDIFGHMAIPRFLMWLIVEYNLDYYSSTYKRSSASWKRLFADCSCTATGLSLRFHSLPCQTRHLGLQGHTKRLSCGCFIEYNLII